MARTGNMQNNTNNKNNNVRNHLKTVRITLTAAQKAKAIFLISLNHYLVAQKGEAEAHKQNFVATILMHL